MDNITKGSLNDEEIKAATARLQDLVINNANPADIDLAQSNLRELIAVRNTYRFTPKIHISFSISCFRPDFVMIARRSPRNSKTH